MIIWYTSLHTVITIQLVTNVHTCMYLSSVLVVSLFEYILAPLSVQWGALFGTQWRYQRLYENYGDNEHDMDRNTLH